ncbi:MAG TPA: hypothetical protein VGP24_09735 [Glaciihabitans sp.]|jgi:hypothetical protein|nr:hypothetical protein [Glaciihabitans sp.]
MSKSPRVVAPGSTVLATLGFLISGTVFGVALGVTSALVSSIMSGSWDYVLYACLAGALVGAGVAITAGIGASIALTVFDNRAQCSPRIRAFIAGLGTAAIVAAVCALVLHLADGIGSDVAGAVLVAAVAVLAGLIAGAGLWAFERRLRKTVRRIVVAPKVRPKPQAHHY